MELDFWKSKRGYTIGLEESSLIDITPDEWDYLIERIIDLFGECREGNHETTDIAVGEHTIRVDVDSLPKLIAMMVDLSHEPIPEDYGYEDSLYRCLMLDLPEAEEGEDHE